jgi:hypothetical protein
MVNFEKYLEINELEKETDPIKIFEDLDKETGKEELWIDQKTILTNWYSEKKMKEI